MEKIEELLVRDTVCGVLVNDPATLPAVARILQVPVSDLPDKLPNELQVETPTGPVMVLNFQIPENLSEDDRTQRRDAIALLVSQLPLLAKENHCTYLVVQGYSTRANEGSFSKTLLTTPHRTVFMCKRVVLIHKGGCRAALIRDQANPCQGSFDIEPLV